MRIGTMRVEEARVFDSEAGYHPFHSEAGEPYGSYEVFWHDGGHMIEADDDDMPLDDWRDAEPAGWYWIACFPGCMPDSDAPSGPFSTSYLACEDADEYLPD